MSNRLSSQQIGEGTFQLRCNLDFGALREKLRCEYGPTAVQADAITGLLSDVDKDLEDCDTEVDRLHSRLIFLRNQRRLLEEYRTQLRFLQSPIRRLPNETVLRIFDFACDINELTSRKLESMPALAISTVCARWRNLVKSHPSLWSRIRLAVQSIPSNDFPILDLYNESSQQTPLTIDFTGTIETLEPHHLAVCAALAAQANRWQQLTVHELKVHKALIAQSPQTYSALQTLLFPRFNILHLDCYKNSFQLRRLSASSIPSENVANIRFPWRQLEWLSLAHHPEGMKNILAICENLTELQFVETEAAGCCELSLPPTAAPAVKTLMLSVAQTSMSKSLAEVVFSSTTCPSLTTLLLESRNRYRRPWPKEALHKFITRSSCFLTTLSIKSIPLSDSDLIGLLRHFPSLLHFTLDDSWQSSSPITLRLIQSLHAFPSPVSSVLVQRLQTLHLTFSGYYFDDGEFVEMLSSRWLRDDRTRNFGLFPGNVLNLGVGTVCLRSVVIRFKNRKMDEDNYKLLTYLEKAGMRVALFNSGVSHIQ